MEKESKDGQYHTQMYKRNQLKDIQVSMYPIKLIEHWQRATQPVILFFFLQFFKLVSSLLQAPTGKGILAWWSRAHSNATMLFSLRDPTPHAPCCATNPKEVPGEPVGTRKVILGLINVVYVESANSCVLLSMVPAGSGATALECCHPCGAAH